jgi:hypothetical protein
VQEEQAEQGSEQAGEVVGLPVYLLSSPSRPPPPLFFSPLKNKSNL